MVGTLAGASDQGPTAITRQFIIKDYQEPLKTGFQGKGSFIYRMWKHYLNILETGSQDFEVSILK